MSLTSLVYKEFKFDSDEEVFFAMWLEELRNHGIVKVWIKPKLPIHLTEGLKKSYKKIKQLKTKIKEEQKIITILRPSEYTPDFRVKFNSDESSRCLTNSIHSYIYDKDKPFFVDNESIGVFEVKPSFDQNNMERLFVNNQKFIWDKHKIFVNLVEPVELFEKTFMPREAEQYFRYKVVPKKALLRGKKKGDFKFDWKPKTVKEFLNIK